MLSFRFLLLCFLLWCSIPVKGQQATYRLRGFMGVQGGESFTYRLELKDSTRNLLSGYAYTYLNEKNDVKAYVVAEVDRSRKTLLLKELHIVHNNYFRSNAIICLVDALLTYSNEEKSLSGPLITMTAGNGANCSKGSISFANAAELEQLFNPSIAAIAGTPAQSKPQQKPQDVARKPVKIIYDTLPRSQPKIVLTPGQTEKKTPDNITEGKDKSYHWHSAQIVMELWDGNNVDNDRVTVLFNGNEVLQHYTLSKEKKKLTLPVGGNELNIITIIADNEGADPPNTANIMLWDDAVSYEVIAHNTIGKRALIKIRKK
jgi:hypothetical protein